MAHADLVVALNATDTLLHVGERTAVLPHLEVTPADVAATNAAIELYDETGNRLVAQEQNGGVQLVQDGQVADPQLLVDRIALVLARWQVMLTSKPDPLVIHRVPYVSATLPIVLAALAEMFGPLHDPAQGGPPPHQGDDYHTWCHKEGIAH